MTNPTDSQPYAKVTVIVESLATGETVTHTFEKAKVSRFSTPADETEDIQDFLARDPQGPRRPDTFQFVINPERKGPSGRYVRIERRGPDAAFLAQELYAPTEFPDPEGD
jgi:hypothetical protein